MKSMVRSTITVGLTLLLLFFSRTCVFAALEYELREGLVLNWYYEPDPAWPNAYEAGYFHDFNGDGLPDYLIHQSNNTNQDRIFCLNTSNSDVPKTFENDRTASRLIDWAPGTFIPDDIHLEKEINQKRTPDIILVGKNAQDPESVTQFIFWKLDETSNTFPTQTTWSIEVDGAYNPDLLWSAYSFNADQYPDFFIYNQLADAQGLFRIRCFDGMNGTLLWERTISKAPGDIGGLFGSSITLQVLQISPEVNTTGDFDGDGKPEILLYYTYSYIQPPISFGVVGNVTLLKGADGQNLASPQYNGWWQVFDYEGSTFVSGSALWDYNGDTYVDLDLSASYSPTGAIPVLRVIDLKNKADLFQTTNSDFGPNPEDAMAFFAMPARHTDQTAPADINNDSFWDLVFVRMTAFGQGDTEIHSGFGVFNAYDGGGAQKGRKIWLADGAPYDYAQYMPNDWNSDGLLDYVLVRNPAEPSGGSIQWSYALQNVGAAGPTTPQKTFDTSISYDGPYNGANDEFMGWTYGLARLGDIDGDGLQDTSASHFCEIDYGDDGTTDLAYARVFVFDNTPGTAAPEITADFFATLTNEDDGIGFFLTFAFDPWREEFVDQNGDKRQNDILITGERAIFALSFSKGPSVKIQGKAGDLTGDNEITVADSVVAFQVSAGLEPPAAFDIEADVNGDGKISLQEILYVLQVLAEVKTVFGLGSDAFSYLGIMPSKYTADGQNVSPPLSWTYAPDGTQSYVLIVDDLDAPGGGWTHWIVYDISAGRTSLAEGAGAQGSGSLPSGAHHGTNSWSNSYYQGPDPASGVHRYAFSLYALDISQLNPAGTERAQIYAAMTGHILDQAQFVGTYAR